MSGTDNRHGAAHLRPDRFMFHPLEISICGPSGSGKTTLLERLIQQLAPLHRVGYVKHDAHRFQIDHAGKDSWRAADAGAMDVGITSSAESAHRHFGEWDLLFRSQAFAGCDFVLAEGWKQSTGMDKILMLDGAGDPKACPRLEACVTAGPLEAARRSMRAAGLEALPLFQRDMVDELAAWLVDRFTTRLQATPLRGLVLAGGRSSRMGRDKALIAIDGVPLAERMARLLEPVCQDVRLSVRDDQAAERQALGRPLVTDRYLGLGPMGGILSAMDSDPQAAWFVLGCDLPLLDRRTLQHLCAERDPWKMATSYDSSGDGLPEPLCTIWEPRSRQRLLGMLGLGIRCPRKVLLQSATRRVQLASPDALLNMNRPEDLAVIEQQQRNGAVTR